jgi:diaminohydroxyphosphoribosylaminopyrimidine deaminase / 5-amino-6-(5-phosphoribosylamino)uracil reductase
VTAAAAAPADDAFSEADRRFMRQALRLAERGRGFTHPNPVVGAVLVAHGRVIASGHHQRAGGPHAEVVALDALARSARARGATLYVTLEPCCHTGRTGPCTDRLLAAGIRRVVVGSRDDNPLVAGRGITRLRRAGVQVDVGCLEQACRAANRGFFRWIREHRPHVTLKAAATLDGFIAPPRPVRPGSVHWITGTPARAAAHRLRARHDAILVGAGTVIADDPRLTVRLPGPPLPRPPRRLVLDGRLRTPPTARLFRERGAPPLVIAGRPARLPARAARELERRARALGDAGAEVQFLPADARGQVPLPALLRHLGTRELQSLLVEGGSAVHGAFIAARLVDEVALFLAPRLQGGGVPIAAGPALPWDAPLRLGPPRVEQIAGDILLAADVEASIRR